METIYRPKKLNRAGGLFSVFLMILIMLSSVANALDLTVNISGQGSVTIAGGVGTYTLASPGGTVTGLLGNEVVDITANPETVPQWGFWMWGGADVASVDDQYAAVTSINMGAADKVITLDLRKVITVTVVVPATRVYDGTNLSAITSSTPSAALSGGVVLNAPANATFADKNVGIGKTVSAIYSLTATPGTEMLQGTTPLSLNATFTANPSDITAFPFPVNAVTDSRLYNGTTSSVGVPTFGALFAGDLVATAPTQVFSNKDFGVGNKTLIASGLVINDGNGGLNYAVTYVNFTTGTINKLPLVVNAVTDTKTYDGTTTSVGVPTFAALMPGDVVATAPTQAFTTKHFGVANKTLVASGLVINDGNGGLNYSVTYNNFTTGTINKLALAVTALTDTKVYDGLTTSLPVPTYPALMAGDVQTTAPSQTFDNKNAGTNKTLTPAGLVINDGNGGLNYAVTYVVNATGVITPLPIAVIADAKTKVYGNVDPALTYTFSPALIAPDAFTGALSRVAGENVGTYEIQRGTLALSTNYTLNYTPALLTITQRPITVAANSFTKSRCDLDPVFTYTVTAGSLAAGDAFSGLLTRDAGADPGVYNINKGGLTIVAGAVNKEANYNFTYVGGTLTINDGPVYITLTIIGDGNVVIRKADNSVAGNIYGPVVGTTVGPFSYNEVLTIDGLARSGYQFFNWTGSLTGTTALLNQHIAQCNDAITAKFVKTINPLTDISFVAPNKVYNSLRDVPGATATYTGAIFPGHGNITITWTSVLFSDKNVGNGKTVTFSGLAIAGPDAGYYALSGTTGTTTANITKFGLTVINAVAQNKVYDGGTNAVIAQAGPLLPITPVVVFSGDVVTLANTTTGTFAQKNVGTWTVTSAMTLAGTDAGNYSLTQPTLSATITAKPLTLGPIVVANKVYNGGTVATVSSWGSLSGIISPDGNSNGVTFVTTGYVANFNNSYVGNNKPVTITGVTLAGVNSGNYSLAMPLNALGNIVPPVYAMFNPTYMVGRPVNPLTNVRIDVPLTIDFSAPIFDVNGEAVVNSSVGDLVKIEKWDGGNWVVVPFTANRSGNKVTLTLATATGKLDYSSSYRLRFLNIYSQPGVVNGTPVDYTLDKDPILGFDNTVVGALIADKIVLFNTMSEYTASLPTVYPYGTDKGVCDVIKVEFVNPVKYRNGLPINDPPSHKFQLEKKSLGGSWTIVPPANWSVTTNIPGAPTLFTFTTTSQLDFCTEYRFKMNVGLDNDYGFTDMVTGYSLMDAEYIFPTQQGIDGWNWKTKCCYNYLVDIAPWPVNPEFGTRPNNLNNVSIAGDGNLITYSGIPIQAIKNTNPYTICKSGTGGGGSAPVYQWQSELGNNTFDNVAGTTNSTTLLAVNGEGYHWVSWMKNNVIQTKQVGTPPVTVNIGPDFPFNFDAQIPVCNQMDTYKANFEINTYPVTQFAYNGTGTTPQPSWGTVTRTPSVNPVNHGTQVVVTAVPQPGYYFVGWQYTLPASFNATEVVPQYFNGVTPPERYVQNPQLATATLTFTILGNLVNNTAYQVIAKFAVYEPIVRAASGMNGTGTQPVDVPIGEIDITTPFVANILQTGYETPSFQGLNYQWARMVYNTPVTLTAKNAPCKYTFVEWQRWTPSQTSTGTWASVGTNLVLGPVAMNQDYRYKAVYKLKDDSRISANAITKNTTIPTPVGTVVMQKFNNCTLTGFQYVNDPVGTNFTYGDVIKLISHPEPNNYTWRWEDGAGNAITTVPGNYVPCGTPPPVGQIQLITRYEDRSEWIYTVGCSSVDLKAIVDLKEYQVVVRSLNTTEGTINSSTPVYVAGTGNQGGLGFVFSNDGIGRKGQGKFQRTKAVTFSATPANSNWAFSRWETPGGVTISTVNPYTIASLDGPVELIAKFVSTLPPPPTYAVNTVVDPLKGSITGGGNYLAAAPVTLTATAKAGYTFANWTYTFTAGQPIVPTLTQSQLNQPTISFNMPAGAVTFTANFVLTQYTVNTFSRTYLRPQENFTIVNYGGTVTTFTNTFTMGQTVTAVATPNPGFRFVNWMTGVIQDPSTGRILRGQQETANTTLNYVIPAVLGNPPVNLYAIFVEIATPQYCRVNFATETNPTGYGVTTGDGYYAFGVEVNVSQKVTKPGYQFTGWSGTGLPVLGTPGAEYVQMNQCEDRTLTANYGTITYQLSVWGPSNSNYGYVTGSNSYTVLSDPLPVNAYVGNSTLCNDYVFEGWFRDAAYTIPLLDAGGTPITADNFFFIPEVVPFPGTVVNIFGKFAPVTRHYTVETATALNTLTNLNTAVGTTTVTGLNGATAPWTCNVDVQVSTTPNPGYEFQGWYDELGIQISSLPTFIYSVIDNRSFTALYDAIPYTVTANAQTGGTVAPASQIKTIGQTVSVTATANAPCYEFYGWDVVSGSLPAGTSLTANPIQWIMPANGSVSLLAKFRLINYTVTASAALPGGSVSPLTQTKVCGNTVTVTATPLCGYTFTSWTATGITAPTANPAVFTMPGNNVTLVANFTATPYALTVTSVPANGGTFTPTNATYTIGQAVSLTATPNPGFIFSNWTVTGITLTPAQLTNPALSFNMPCNAVGVTANFNLSTNVIKGQVKYFNQYETVMPQSAKIKVALDNGGVLSQEQFLTYTAGSDQGSYEFTNIVPGTNYTVRLWEAPTVNTVANTWSWNNWGGVNSLDALIISYMYLNNPSLPTQFPWLTNGAAVPNWTALFGGFGTSPVTKYNVANVDNNSTIDNLDALLAMYRSIGQPGTSPFPGGAFNFQVAGQILVGGATMSYPMAPTAVFAQNGSMTPTNAANSIYFTRGITGAAGAQIFNIYYVATGDVNASYVPASNKSTSNLLAYNNVLKVNVGEEISIPVTINQDVNMGAMTIGLNYNTSLLKVTGVEGFEVFNINEENGTINATMFNVNGSKYNANSNVIIVKATVLAPISASTRYFELENNTMFADASATLVEGVTLTAPALTTDNAASIGENTSADLTHKAYPNPFNNVSNIQYTLPETAKVEVNVYNSLGGLVKKLVNETQVAGVHTVQLKNTDLYGAGVYYYRITVRSDSRTTSGTGSLVLIK